MFAEKSPLVPVPEMSSFCRIFNELLDDLQYKRRLSAHVGGGYLEDHPRTRKWLITMVSKSPK